MTSQSLKKLQTIQWSMPPKTDGFNASRGVARWLRDAGLAGLAAITLASGVNADNASRSARLGPPRSVPSDAASTPAAADQTPNSSFVVPVVFATRTRELPTEPVAPEPVTSEQFVSQASETLAPPALPALESAPVMVEQSAPSVPCQSCSEYGHAEGCDNGHASRIKYLLSGGMMISSADSVGDWWQHRSQQMLERSKLTNRAKRKEARQRLAGTKDRLIDRITLPDDPDLDVDLYDVSPKMVMSPIMQTAGEEDSSSTNEKESSAGSNRLNTDIRTIKPSLSYAMKNISREQLPEDFDDKIDNGQYVARESGAKVLQWAPTNLYHYPLYFEDPSLERYGHAYHPLVQPFASYGRFATQLVGLPYQMALHPVNSKQYTLGYYRPGECAPKKHYQIPFNEEATIVEVATIIGFILIFP